MIIKNGVIFVNGRFIKKDIEITDDTITSIGDNMSGSHVVDAHGQKVLPGIVDIHTHGNLGIDFCTASVEEINNCMDFYCKNGVTSILATVMTIDKLHFRQAMKNIKFIMDMDGKNCIIKGINLEGPFLSPSKKGAHNPAQLMAPDIDFFNELWELSGHNIKLVDLAPELPNSLEFIEYFRGKTTLSIAHTSCDYNLALLSFQSGARHITHMFNAMNGINHRTPGPIPAFFDSEDIYAEMICDGVHIDPSIIRMCFKLKPDNMVIISDSISATGLPDGKYVSGGLDIYVKDGTATLLDKTIAGSTVTNFQSMSRAISFGVNEAVAIKAATENAAKSVGLDSKIGSIAVGNTADLIIVDDNYNLSSVIKSGVVVKNHIQRRA